MKPQIKFCRKCDLWRSGDEFSKDKTKADGLYPKCKTCTKMYYDANREHLISNAVEWGRHNPDKKRGYERAFRKNHPDREAAYARGYYLRNADKMRAHARQRARRYYEKNRDAISERRKAAYIARKSESVKVDNSTPE